MRRLDSDQNHKVEFVLNGQPIEGRVYPRTLLSDFLREELGKSGTHIGCEHGVCGACTIRINGSAARSCLTLAVQVEGTTIETVENLSPDAGKLSILQEAFQKHHALQCGFCTPGILISLETLLAAEPNAGRERIREILSGHLCRCTGYHAIVNAACDAAETLRQQKEITNA